MLLKGINIINNNEMKLLTQFMINHKIISKDGILNSKLILNNMNYKSKFGFKFPIDKFENITSNINQIKNIEKINNINGVQELI